MSEHDEAMQAARRIEKRCQQLLLAKINPERDLIGFGDAMVVARALLSREAEQAKKPVSEFALEGAKEVSAADEAYYRSMGLPSLEETWKKYSERAIVNGAVIANELLRLSRDDDTD